MKKIQVFAALTAALFVGVAYAGPACCGAMAATPVEGAEVTSAATAEAPAKACCEKVDGKCTAECLAKKAAKCGEGCAAKKAAGETPACCAAKAACTKAAAEKADAPAEEKTADAPVVAPATK